MQFSNAAVPIVAVLVWAAVMAVTSRATAAPRDYQFDGKISRPVPDNGQEENTRRETQLLCEPLRVSANSAFRCGPRFNAEA